MTRNKNILTELQQISPAVANLNPVTPYSIPSAYFETLASVIAARIAAGGISENSLLSIARNQMPQEVPAGYFNNLSQHIFSKLKTQTEQTVAEELHALSPVLAALPKNNLYHLPAEYFENFTVLKTEQTASATKIVSMYSKKPWIQFAAAAVLFVFIAFGIQFFTKPPVVSNTTAGVPQNLTEQQFNTELASISDDDIINYLKFTADSKDAETLCSMVDASSLPNEADYMDVDFLNSLMKEMEQDKNTIN